MNAADRVLEVLDPVECRRLLGTARVGRLGFTDGALPEILPFPFTLDDDSLRIPAGMQTRVVDAVRRAVVAFAVDSYDVDERTGWGVTVIGPAQVTTGAAAGRPPGEVRRPGTERAIVVRLGLLRGWRLRRPAEPVPGPAGADVRSG